MFNGLEEEPTGDISKRELKHRIQELKTEGSQLLDESEQNKEVLVECFKKLERCFRALADKESFPPLEDKYRSKAANWRKAAEQNRVVESSALSSKVDGSAADQPGETADQDLDADDDNEVVAEEVPPTRHLDDLIGEDLLARLYTRVVSQIMAAYEIEADIPVYEQENDNPGSYLFTGEPGTGKTHAAEGVAFVLRDLGYDVGFYPVLGSQIKQSEYGESEDRLRRLLRRADDDGHELSVVFFDEFEDIATRNEHHATAAIANTLQSLTSGADVVDSVVVIGATNHSERISDAIHNRFTDVEFQEPSREAKIEMLEHYLGEACDFDSKRLVSLDDDLFDGLTGRDIKLAARDAADHSLLPTESSRPTSVSEMETVREQLQQTPNVSIDDVRLALANRH